MTTESGVAGSFRGRSQRTVGILAAIGASTAWGLGATTSDYVLSSGMGNDTFLVLELSVGFAVLMAIGALLGTNRYLDIEAAKTGSPGGLAL